MPHTPRAVRHGTGLRSIGEPEMHHPPAAAFAYPKWYTRAQPKPYAFAGQTRNLVPDLLCIRRSTADGPQKGCGRVRQLSADDSSSGQDIDGLVCEGIFDMIAQAIYSLSTCYNNADHRGQPGPGAD